MKLTRDNNNKNNNNDFGVYDWWGPLNYCRRWTLSDKQEIHVRKCCSLNYLCIITNSMKENGFDFTIHSSKTVKRRTRKTKRNRVVAARHFSRCRPATLSYGEWREPRENYTFLPLSLSTHTVHTRHDTNAEEPRERGSYNGIPSLFPWLCSSSSRQLLWG